MKTSKQTKNLSFLNAGMCGLAFVIGILALFYTVLPNFSGSAFLASVFGLASG